MSTAHGSQVPRAHDGRASPSRRRRSVAAAGLLTAGAVGLSLLGGLGPTLAQRTPEQTVQTPFGRAPLSFADIVERVKPAVVSIQVTAGGRAQASAGRPNRGGGSFRICRMIIP